MANQPADQTAQNFMQKLKEAEANHDVRNLAALFDADADLENLTRPTIHRGAQQSTNTEPSAFWRQYLTAFEHIESNFTHVMDNGSSAVMEWRSEGRLSTGQDVEYSGVSIIEYTGDRIQKFRTYYDSAALLPHAAKSDKKYSESVGQPEITTGAGA